MAHGSTDTVVTSVTTTNDDDVLAFGGDVVTVLELRIKQGLRVELKVLHGEVDTICVTSRNSQVARPCRTSADNDCVMLSPDVLNVNVNTNVGVRNERLFTGNQPERRC